MLGVNPFLVSMYSMADFNELSAGEDTGHDNELEMDQVMLCAVGGLGLGMITVSLAAESMIFWGWWGETILGTFVL